MGYYSYYRILKDVIKTIFNNKVWRFFLIFVIICIVLSHILPNDSFAVSFIASNNTQYTIPLDFPFNTSTYPYIYINIVERTNNGITYNYFDVYYSSQPATWVGRFLV